MNSSIIAREVCILLCLVNILLFNIAPRDLASFVKVYVLFVCAFIFEFRPCAMFYLLLVHFVVACHKAHNVFSMLNFEVVLLNNRLVLSLFLN